MRIFKGECIVELGLPGMVRCTVRIDASFAPGSQSERVGHSSVGLLQVWFGNCLVQV